MSAQASPPPPPHLHMLLPHISSCSACRLWPNPHLSTTGRPAFSPLTQSTMAAILTPVQSVRYPAQLAHYIQDGLRVYFFEQGIFRINLREHPFRQWVSLSSSIRPSDYRNHCNDAFLLLEQGDLVATTGDMEDTREVWDSAAEHYVIRVKVTVSLMKRARSPAPGISEGWITLFPVGHSMGGNITHMSHGPAFTQPDSVLEWFAGRHHHFERIGPFPILAPPGDRIPRTPSQGPSRATSSTRGRKRQASDADSGNNTATGTN